MKNKYIISTSTLIALLLLNTQPAYAEEEEQIVDTEPVITNVQEEIDDIYLDEKKSDDTKNQQQDTELPPILLQDETNDNPQEHLESEKNQAITEKVEEMTQENVAPATVNEASKAQARNAKTADDFIKEYADAYYVSKLWSISQEFKEAYPNHESLSGVINDAATKNLTEGLRVHQNSDFELASVYYQRVFDEELVNQKNKDLADLYLSYSDNQRKIKTADQYVKNYEQLYYVSEKWLMAQEFKAHYPGDNRVSNLINDAATENIKEGQRAHHRSDFDTASIYYNRVLSEELVNNSVKGQANNLLKLAKSQTQFRYANEFYQEYLDAYYVSNKWMIAQEFKSFYAGDPRVVEVINDAASENIKEGQRAHQQSDFSLASIYYNRVLSEELISATLEDQVKMLLDLVESQTRFRSANDFYKEYSESYYVSDKWTIAQDFKAFYPNDSRVAEVVNDAANENIKEGQRAHRRSDFDLASIYYNRVRSDSLLEQGLKSKVTQLLDLANSKIVFKSADEFYNEYLDTYYVSELWRIAQAFKAIHPNDIRVQEVVNDAAVENLKEGLRAHNKNDYKLALIYYNRIVDENLLNGTTLLRTQKSIEYAKSNRPIKSVSAYTSEYKKAYYVSNKWEIAKEFKVMHPDSGEAAEAMIDAANGILKEGRNAQRRGDNATARVYYNRILSEELADESNRYLASVFLKQTSATHTPVIYIDAGHGGTDPGATHQGVYEKVLNLNVSNYLKTELENRGYIVLMSRSVDKFVELSDRPFEANDSNVDAFISVHHNSMGGNGAARGLETFVFHRIESGFGQETNHNNFNLDQPRINESLLLANLIHTNLVRNTGLNNRGVKGNNFNVLRNSYAPAVLLELGFMDNRSELSRINTRSYQQQAARSVAVGIDNYFKGIN